MRESDPLRRKRKGSMALGLTPDMAGLLYLREALPDRYECVCKLCQAQYEKTLLLQYKAEPKECSDLTEKPSIKKLQGENCYAFVMECLLEVGSFRARSLAVSLPDTILFSDGGPKCIIYTASPRQQNLKIIRQKEKLTYLQLRKFLDERRKKYNSQVRARSLELTSASLQTKELFQSVINPEYSSVARRLDQKLSSMRDSVGGSLIRSKLDNYMSVRTDTNKSNQPQLQGQELNRTKKQRELCLVSYRDNTTQIISPLQYAFLFERRKIDPYWHTVSSIQNILKSFGSYQYKEVKFRNCRIADPALYERAKIQIRILTETFSREEFVPTEAEDQFRSQLRSSDQQRYLLYTTYKIIQFLEVQGLTIYHGNFYYLKDVLGTIYFMDCNSLYYSRRQLSSASDDLNMEESIQLQIEQATRKSYIQHERSVVRKICIDMLANAMELRKIELRLDAYQNPPRHTVEKIFGEFHPEFENNLIRIINSVNWKRDVEQEIDKVRQRTHYLIHHSEGLKILHLHGIFFTKTLANARPQPRSLSARLPERRMSLPLFSNNFKAWKQGTQRGY